VQDVTRYKYKVLVNVTKYCNQYKYFIALTISDISSYITNVIICSILCVITQFPTIKGHVQKGLHKKSAFD